MVDIDKSPHSEHERKVQRLYEVASEIMLLWDNCAIVHNLKYSPNDHDANECAFEDLEQALSAFDGKAFNEVKS